MELDGIIAMHRYNSSIVAEYMASSVNNCVQVAIVTGCSMRMSCPDGSRRNYDCVDVITNLSEVDNAMSFLTINHFISGPVNPPGINVTWMSQHLTIDVDGKTIYDNKIAMEGYNAIRGKLPADQENHKIFNIMEGEWDVLYL